MLSRTRLVRFGFLLVLLCSASLGAIAQTTVTAAGAVYIFELAESAPFTPQLKQTINASYPQTGGEFGSSLVWTDNGLLVFGGNSTSNLGGYNVHLFKHDGGHTTAPLKFSRSVVRQGQSAAAMEGGFAVLSGPFESTQLQVFDSEGTPRTPAAPVLYGRSLGVFGNQFWGGRASSTGCLFRMSGHLDQGQYSLTALPSLCLPKAGGTFGRSFCSIPPLNRIVAGDYEGGAQLIFNGSGYTMYAPGNAHIFTPDGEYLTSLTSPSPRNFEGFGADVAWVGGNLLAVSSCPSLNDFTTTATGSIYLFDAATSQPVRTISAPVGSGPRFGSSIEGSPDGFLLALDPFGGAVPRTFCFSAATGNKLWELAPPKLGAGGTAMALSGRRLAISHVGASALLYPPSESPTSLSLLMEEREPTELKFRVRLRWSDNTNFESGYLVERSLNADGPFELVERLPINSTEYDRVITGENGRSSFYRVRAVNAAGASGATSVAEAVFPRLDPPTAPTSLTARLQGQDVWLQWDATAGNATYQRVERSSSPTGPFALFSTVAGDREFYFHWIGTEKPGKVYYRVSAINGVGQSEPSNTVETVFPDFAGSEPGWELYE